MRPRWEHWASVIIDAYEELWLAGNYKLAKELLEVHEEILDQAIAELREERRRKEEARA